MKKIDVLGIEFDDTTLPEAVEFSLAQMEQRQSAYVVTPNPEIVLMAQKNQKLKAAAAGASLVLPDGIGVVYASRILGTALDNRVPGIDFASALMARMGELGKTVFLLGAKPGIAKQAGLCLQERFPGLRIAGTRDGYFAKEEEPELIREINAVEPDFLVVCLGSPKQEIWMRDNAGKLRVGLMAGLGGALDVYAGTVERAPEQWREKGLEWLYRLIKEPKRITRMVKLPGILLAALWQRIGG